MRHQSRLDPGSRPTVQAQARKLGDARSWSSTTTSKRPATSSPHRVRSGDAKPVTRRRHPVDLGVPASDAAAD